MQKEQLDLEGIRLVSNKESIDSSTPTGKLMLTMIGAINEFERTNLLERQREGIAIATCEGAYSGCKAADPPEFAEHFPKWQRHEISKAELARRCNVSRPTIDRLIAQTPAD